MKRSALVLVGLAMLLFPRPASAGWIWAWFEDLSGPRFRGSPWNLRLICIEDSKPTSRLGAAEVFASLDLTQDLVLAYIPNEASKQPAAAGQRPFSERIAELKAALPSLAERAVVILRLGSREGAERANELADELYKFTPPLPGRQPPPATRPQGKYADESAACQDSRVRAATADPIEAIDRSLFRTIRAVCDWRIYFKREGITAGGSVLLSLCAAPGGGPRRVSIDLNFRSMSDADETRDKTLSFSSLSPAVTFHLLDPAIHKKWDFVDVGLAVGFFWVRPSDESLQAFSGVMVEPIRFDFHAPPMVDESSLWPLGIPYFQYGLVWFPTGFAPKSFAAEGPFSGKYPPEVIRAWSLYFNLTPVVRRVLPNVFGGVKR